MVTNSGWLQVEHGDVQWRIDAGFLGSNWSCIWNGGCQGIERVANAEAGLGCCSVGAELLDDDEAMTIGALAATIDPGDFQFREVFVAEGAFAEERTAAGSRNTRVVEGACIFLNRPGFAGGHGCVLHAEAERQGESALDWKPSICWQLPLKIEREGTTATLRRWRREDWGPEGGDMAWCCTEGDRAYVGEQPVAITLREELGALLGDELAEEIAQRLEDNGS